MGYLAKNSMETKLKRDKGVYPSLHTRAVERFEFTVVNLD
jgi:hypothetical protein